MNKQWIALGVLCFASHAAVAALPPTAESMVRIKNIVSSNEVYDKLGSNNWITSVKQTPEGYELSSDKCTLQVALIEGELRSKEGKPMVGPRPLKLKIGELVCK